MRARHGPAGVDGEGILCHGRAPLRTRPGGASLALISRARHPAPHFLSQVIDAWSAGQSCARPAGPTGSTGCSTMPRSGKLTDRGGRGSAPTLRRSKQAHARRRGELRPAPFGIAARHCRGPPTGPMAVVKDGEHGSGRKSGRRGPGRRPRPSRPSRPRRPSRRGRAG